MKAGKLAVLACLVVLIIPGCASYQTHFRDGAKARGFTNDQTEAMLYDSYRLFFAKLNEDGQYTILYSRLSLQDMREQVDRFLRDLNDILDYKNPEATQYVKMSDTRRHFEHQETVFKAIRSRIRVAEINCLFDYLTKGTYGGQPSEYGYSSYGTGAVCGYDPVVLSTDDMPGKFPFEKQTINEAKKRGILQEVERFTLRHDRKLDHKEVDPNGTGDKNEFVWRPNQYQLEVVKYKIMVSGERPKDANGHYVEVYRLSAGDKPERESRPAVKAFLDGQGGFAVAVIDTDRESDATGFGLPDYVERMYEKDLFSEGLFARLYPERTKHRTEPQLPPIRVEITRLNSNEEQFWENAPDDKGWTVPFGYKVGPLNVNYNVRLQFKERKNGSEHAESVPPLPELEYIAKEWTGSGGRYNAGEGRVIEYFQPKPPYNAAFASIKVSSDEDTRKLVFIYPDGNEKVGYVTPGENLFTATKPTAIAFTLGEKRWLIKDEDGDGVYEKRKQISEPSFVTGEYRGAGALTGRDRLIQ